MSPLGILRGANQLSYKALGEDGENFGKTRDNYIINIRTIIGNI